VWRRVRKNLLRGVHPDRSRGKKGLLFMTEKGGEEFSRQVDRKVEGRGTPHNSGGQRKERAFSPRGTTLLNKETEGVKNQKGEKVRFKKGGRHILPKEKKRKKGTNLSSIAGRIFGEAHRKKKRSSSGRGGGRAPVARKKGKNLLPPWGERSVIQGRKDGDYGGGVNSEGEHISNRGERRFSGLGRGGMSPAGN